MCRREFAKTRCMGSQDQGDDPPRHIFAEVHRGGICDMEEPAGFREDRNAAVATRMTEERHEPHLRIEGQANGRQPEPGFAAISVEDEVRVMSQVTADVGQIRPAEWRACESFVFSLVNMDAGVGEIRQSAAVIEVHVGQHHVTHVHRIVTEKGDLPDCSLVRIQRHMCENLESAKYTRLVNVVPLARTCVDEHEPLVGFDQQA